MLMSKGSCYMDRVVGTIPEMICHHVLYVCPFCGPVGWLMMGQFHGASYTGLRVVY